MGSGYVLLAKGADALALFHDPDVRYAAAMTDGTGFVAFDTDHGQFADKGNVWYEGEHGPEAIFWPYQACPKRAIGTEGEAFALIPQEWEADIHKLTHVTGCVPVGDGMILVQSDGPVVMTADYWNSVVRVFLDKRIDRHLELV